MSDEQRVRTMAGWIGVEISRSRVRTPGKAGYGLYRVRAARDQQVRRTDTGPGFSRTSEPYWVPSPWTAYAFGLDEVKRAVEVAIRCGRPAGPERLVLDGPGAAVIVPTRWTQAYRGRRDLGVMTAEQAERLVMPARVTDAYARQVSALEELLGAGLVQMQHVEGCVCDEATGRMDASCVRATMPDRMRQRADDAAFQAEHLERRRHGLVKRYEQKARRTQ